MSQAVSPAGPAASSGVFAPVSVRPIVAAPPALALEGLHKRWSDGTAVLRGIDLAVTSGQSVALIGANGSGKSTLLRCCLRLTEPSAGKVHILGEAISTARGGNLRRLRRRVGFVFQKHNLVDRLSVLSNVVHGALGRAGLRSWHQAVAPARVRAEAMACLERVGLADLATRRADQLSGGQSQRVAIARALMQRPALVFADEPVASLDPTAAEEVMALFARLMRDEGVTVVFTTHHLHHARDHADRVVALRSGMVMMDRAANQVDFTTLGDLYAH